jgi:hypothetical protein
MVAAEFRRMTTNRLSPVDVLDAGAGLLGKDSEAPIAVVAAVQKYADQRPIRRRLRTRLRGPSAQRRHQSAGGEPAGALQESATVGAHHRST